MTDAGNRPVRAAWHAGLTGIAWQTWLAAAALAVAIGALLWRFVLVGDAALTFNEATYVELARHPWYASYYPDELFVRHPPIALLLLSVVQVFGEAAWLMRIPALLATAAGIVLSWDAARRLGGPWAAAFVAVVLAASFPIHAYAIKASLYGPVFLMAALAVWAHGADRPRLLTVSFVLFALTHLFGFLFLALHLWYRWRAGTRPMRLLAASWPAWLWLVGAAVLGVLLNHDGDIMRLGPLGQFLRSGANAGKAVAVSPLVHLASGGLGILVLGPVLLFAAWHAARRDRRALPLVVGLLVIALYLPFGAPYPRYALAALPIAVVLGGAQLVRHARPWAGLALATALVTIPVGFAYVTDGPDPRAAGDVPGLQDWEAAVAAAWDAGLVQDGTIIATSAPTSVAYYLGQQGLEVVDRDEAPYVIGLQGEAGAGAGAEAGAEAGAAAGDRSTIVRLDAPDDPRGLETGAHVFLMPTAWGRPPTEQDMGRVAQVDGVTVWATSMAVNPPKP